jgi:hypothetical protein
VSELISHTTTRQGLVVTAIKDAHTYPTGITVSNEEREVLPLIRDAFHGEWNSTFLPENKSPQGQVM